jgi:hypothetical protein
MIDFFHYRERENERPTHTGDRENMLRIQACDGFFRTSAGAGKALSEHTGKRVQF